MALYMVQGAYTAEALATMAKTLKTAAYLLENWCRSLEVG